METHIEKENTNSVKKISIGHEQTFQENAKIP